MSTHAMAASAVPIREISRLTGVNTVTLRAWERRYGLLKPMRTNKGHRLYSVDDIQRVKEIQSWLARGLAISKVKSILAPENSASADSVIDGIWTEHAARINSALAQLNRRALEHLLSELTVLYPAELIADRLLNTVVEQLQTQREYTNNTKLAFLLSVVREQFYFGLSRQRRTAKGKRLLVVLLSPQECDILPLILNYSLLVNTYQAEYMGYLPTAELVFATEQMRIDGVILYADSARNLAALQPSLSALRKTLPIPLWLAGKISRVYADDAEQEASFLLSGDTLQATIAAITQHFPPR